MAVKRQVGTLILTGVLAAGAAPAVAKAPTKAKAAAFAKAVNLTAADLPGYTGKTTKPTASAKRISESYARCSGGVDPGKDVVDQTSPNFSLAGAGTVQVGSEVSVLPSAQLVTADLRAAKSARGKACLTKATGEILATPKTPGITYGKVTLTTLKRSAPGSNGSFAFRFKVIARAGGVNVPFYLDSIGFALGPAEVSLTTLGIGQPYSAADEQRLLGLLAGRASFNRL